MIRDWSLRVCPVNFSESSNQTRYFITYFLRADAHVSKDKYSKKKRKISRGEKMSRSICSSDEEAKHEKSDSDSPKEDILSTTPIDLGRNELQVSPVDRSDSQGYFDFSLSNFSGLGEDQSGPSYEANEQFPQENPELNQMLSSLDFCSEDQLDGLGFLYDYGEEASNEEFQSSSSPSPANSDFSTSSTSLHCFLFFSSSSFSFFFSFMKV